MEQLKEFYARRRTVTATIIALTVQQSFLLGSSVIAGALLKFYTPGTTSEYPFFPRDPVTYAFNGLYALALSLLVSYVVGAEVIIPITEKKPQAKPGITATLVSLVPVSFLVGGVSASINYNVPLMYVAFTVLLGFSLAIHDVVSRLEVLQWWAVDGKKRVSTGLVGLAAGLSSIFYTLVTGWILNYSKSLATTLYTLFGIQALISGWIVYAIRTGKMDAPPKPEDVKAWIDEANKEGDAEEAPKADSTQKDQEGEERPGTNSDVPSRPFGTSAAVPVVLKDRTEGFKYPVFYACCLQSFLNCINGYATKGMYGTMRTLEPKIVWKRMVWTHFSLEGQVVQFSISSPFLPSVFISQQCFLAPCLS